jgi:pimeloyl-ACP methyl ester carboxylesterase
MAELRQRRGYVDVPDGQMFYREMGAGDTVVLIHQILRTSLDYSFVMPILARKYRVVAFDWMGCGDSDAPPHAYTIEEHGAAIAAGMAALGIERAAVAGHHSGADVAMEVALQHPEAVSKLVLSGLAYVSDPSKLAELHAKASRLRDPEPVVDGSHLLAFWNEGLNTNWGKPRLPADRLDLVAMFFLEQIKSGPRRFEPYVAQFAYDASRKLPKVRVPILFIRSSDDIFICAASDEWMRDQPTARLVEIEVEGGGEMPRLYPEPWAREILQFLDG